jgi:hemophore-related protein
VRLITRVMVSGACATAALIGGCGIASGEPNADAIYNSTCTYPQVIAALNAQDPAAANQLTSNPIAVGWLQSFVASNPDGRREMATQIQGSPDFGQYAGLINSVAVSCNNF